MYASSTWTTTQRSGVRPPVRPHPSGNGRNVLAGCASFSTIRAVPLTWQPTVDAKKSTNNNPTCAFSEMLPRLAITPLPRYSG